MSCFYKFIESIIKPNNLDLFLNLMNKSDPTKFIRYNKCPKCIESANCTMCVKYGNKKFCCLRNINNFILYTAICNNAHAIANYQVINVVYHPDVLAKLIFHCKNFKQSIFNLFLQNGMNIHYISEKRQSNLLVDFAIQYKNPGLLKQLFSLGVSFNDFNQPPNFLSFFSRKITKKRKKILKILLDNGFDINWAQSFSDIIDPTPLLIAIRSKNYTMVEVLISCGADINFILGQDDVDTRSFPLLTSIEKNDIKMTKLLLDYGADPNLKNKPMETAVIFDRVDIINLLLDYGADPNNDMLILYSIRDNKPGLFRRLLSHIQDIDKTYSSNNTLLHYACMYNNYEIVEMILDRKPNLYLKNSHQSCPIFWMLHCAQNISPEKLLTKTLELFLQRGFDIFACEDEIFVLKYAIVAHNIYIIDSLFKYQPELTMKWIANESFLHYVADAKTMYVSKEISFKILKKVCKHIQDYCNLHESGCPGCLKKYINSFDQHKQTPLFYAVKIGMHEMVECMIENGADVNLLWFPVKKVDKSNEKSNEPSTENSNKKPIWSPPENPNLDKKMKTILRNHGYQKLLMTPKYVISEIYQMIEKENSLFYRDYFPQELSYMIITRYQEEHLSDKYSDLFI